MHSRVTDSLFGSALPILSFQCGAWYNEDSALWPLWSSRINNHRSYFDCCRQHKLTEWVQCSHSPVLHTWLSNGDAWWMNFGPLKLHVHTTQWECDFYMCQVGTAAPIGPWLKEPSFELTPKSLAVFLFCQHVAMHVDLVLHWAKLLS